MKTMESAPLDGTQILVLALDLKLGCPIFAVVHWVKIDRNRLEDGRIVTRQEGYWTCRHQPLPMILPRLWWDLPEAPDIDMEDMGQDIPFGDWKDPLSIL